MGDVTLDWDITKEKLNSMVLALDTDREYLYQTEGCRVLIKDMSNVALAYCCIREISPKSFICFLIPSVFFYSNKLGVAKEIKNMLREYLSKVGWEVVQTVSKNDNIINRWMKFMGFNKIEKIDVPNREGDYFIWRRSK